MIADPHRAALRLPALALAALGLALVAAPVLAHDEATGGEPLPEAVLADFDRAAGKLVSLAEAIPAESYGWRPAEGVRSVSETLMHVAAANFGLAAALGVPAPEGVDVSGLETVTGKDEVLAMLGRSIEHAHKALEPGQAGDLSRQVQFFGNDFTAARVVTILTGHCHEHLGQTIAYARANGVTPPWSAGN